MVEVLNIDPPIYQIYDVLNDMEIDRMLEVAAPFMTRARVKGDSEVFVQSAIRTSATHWIVEGEDSLLARIPARIEMITGLDVRGIDSAEDLQISS